MDVGASTLTMEQVQAAANAAAKAALPPFSDATPRTEMTGGSAGTGAAAIPRPDHQHPRLTATFTGTLASDGTKSVPFTRTFSTKPAVTVLEVDSGGNTPPADFKVQSWTQDAQGNYTGCTIYGSRPRVLPTLTPISGVLTLLSGVISATNAVFQVLSGYVPYEAAGGAQFTLIALQPTTAS